MENTFKNDLLEAKTKLYCLLLDKPESELTQPETILISVLSKDRRVIEEWEDIENKKFMARIWKGLLIKNGEEKIAKEFKRMFSPSTFKKFPKPLTPDGLEQTLLNLSNEELKQCNP